MLRSLKDGGASGFTAPVHYHAAVSLLPSQGLYVKFAEAMDVAWDGFVFLLPLCAKLVGTPRSVITV